jgi:hypothetical protein
LLSIWFSQTITEKKKKKEIKTSVAENAKPSRWGSVSGALMEIDEGDDGGGW